MEQALSRIESGIAAAAYRVADAAPTLVLLGPAAAIAALLVGWIAGLRLAPAA